MSRAQDRMGFTMVEMMVAMVMAVAVGAGLVSLMLSQARTTSRQEAWRESRGAAQSGLNRMLSDLRMVETSAGVEAAAAGGQDITLRVPYAMGVMCSSVGGSTVVNLLPVDSVAFNEPGFSGFAYRSATGVYTYVTAGTAVALGGSATCTGAGVTLVPAIDGSPAGTTVTLTGAVAPVPPVGSLVFMFRRIRYELKASVAAPGHTSLWRTVLATGSTEEIATPLESTSRFEFYVNDATTAQAAVPASLASIRGLQLELTGRSERVPSGATARPQTALTTAVFFKNRPD